MCVKLPFTILHLQLTGEWERDNMATVTNKRMVLWVEGKVEVIRKIEWKKESRRASGTWSRNFYAPNDVEKHTEIMSVFQQKDRK